MLVELKDFSVSFREGTQYYKAIDNLSVGIEKGETVALLGESGCGKSLTALSMMQLLPQNAYIHKDSELIFQNRSMLQLAEKSLRKIRGQEMAMIFQEPMTSLNPVLTIGKQLAEAVLNVERLNNKALKKRCIELLTQVDIPDPNRRILEYPHQLSGGQKQRVMIAIAIAGKPSLLIADEPTTALDVTVEAQILTLLKSLQTSLGMAMLLITHDLSVVRRVADKIAVMYAGEIVELARAEDFFSSPSHPYSRRLLACLPSISKKGNRLNNIEGVVPTLFNMPTDCRFRERCAEAFDQCHVHPGLFKRSENHWVRCHYYAQDEKKVMPFLKVESMGSDAHDTGECLLTVTDLKVYYPIQKGWLKKEVDVLKAVDGVSFSLHRGETLALVGESGCGKSTLARALIQLQPTTSGNIEFQGKTLSSNSRHFRQAMQIVFQDPFSSMNPRMLVEDIILEGCVAQGHIFTPDSRQKKIDTLLTLVGLAKGSAARYPHQFSGGQRQRICIARALAVSPELLICDEPTSALDVSVQAQILNLLKSLQAELGLAYLFISHDLSVVSYLSERIIVMRAGKVIEEGETSDIIHHPKQAYTKALLSAVLT